MSRVSGACSSTISSPAAADNTEVFKSFKAAF